jgi:LysM repeat protein
MARPSPARNPARYLAPIALVVFALALLIVVSTSGGGDDGGGSSSTPASTGKRNTTGGTRSSTTTTSTTPTHVPHFYVIKPGDNLSIIADKTGVPVARIEELNPDVDPQALVTGQRLKLRP